MGRPRKPRNKRTGTLEWRTSTNLEKYPKGGYWLARYMVDGKRYAQSTETADRDKAAQVMADLIAPHLIKDKKLQAEMALNQIAGAEKDLIKAEDKLPAMKLTDAFTAFSKSHTRRDCNEGHLNRYKCFLDRFIKWINKEHPEIVEMRHVTEAHANEFLDSIAKDFSPTTFNRHIVHLKALWKVLRKDARIKENPWADIKHKDQQTHSRRILTTEEMLKVNNAVDGDMRLLFSIGMYTGLRFGDCCLLEWKNVDMVKRIISVIPRKTAKHMHGNPVIIPIHPTLFSALSDLPKTGHKGYVMPEIAEAYQKQASNFSKRISKIFEDCGIKTSTCKSISGRALVDVGFHSLRHTFVSTAANAGAPLALVQSIVGHSNPMMTEHYFHANTEALRETIAALPSISGDVIGVDVSEEDDFKRRLEGLDKAALKRIIAYARARVRV